MHRFVVTGHIIDGAFRIEIQLKVNYSHIFDGNTEIVTAFTEKNGTGRYERHI